MRNVLTPKMVLYRLNCLKPQLLENPHSTVEGPHGTTIPSWEGDPKPEHYMALRGEIVPPISSSTFHLRNICR